MPPTDGPEPESGGGGGAAGIGSPSAEASPTPARMLPSMVSWGCLKPQSAFLAKLRKQQEGALDATLRPEDLAGNGDVSRCVLTQLYRRAAAASPRTRPAALDDPSAQSPTAAGPRSAASSGRSPSSRRGPGAQRSPAAGAAAAAIEELQGDGRRGAGRSKSSSTLERSRFGSSLTTSAGSSQHETPPGKITHLVRLSSHRSLPKYSFGVRPNGLPAPQVPAPGSYETHSIKEEVKSTNHQQPVYRFGGGQKRFRAPPLTGAGELGPGAYGNPATSSTSKYHAERRSGFGGAPRGAIVRCPQITHGPGMYKVRSTVGEGPAVTAVGKPYRKQFKSLMMPGPGAYEPKMAESRFGSAPQIGFGTSLREDYGARKAREAPGPGRYDPRGMLVGQDCPKFSITSRRRHHDLTPLMQPGPGMYGSHSQFGY